MSDAPSSQAVPPPTRSSSIWPKLRAAVITYFVFFNVLAAFPSTGGTSPDRFERPVLRAELERWTQFVRSLGFDIDSTRLARAYLRFAEVVEEVRGFALRPIAWWFELTQTAQSWRLFGTPRERPSALTITATDGSSDQLLYRSRDERHRWRAEILEYRRIRAAYTPVAGRPPAPYEGFVARIASEVFDERQDARKVTVSLVESHTTLPGQEPDLTTRQAHVMERRRPAP